MVLAGQKMGLSHCYVQVNPVLVWVSGVESLTSA